MRKLCSQQREEENFSNLIYSPLSLRSSFPLSIIVSLPWEATSEGGEGISKCDSAPKEFLSNKKKRMKSPLVASTRQWQFAFRAFKSVAYGRFLSRQNSPKSWPERVARLHRSSQWTDCKWHYFLFPWVTREISPNHWSLIVTENGGGERRGERKQRNRRKWNEIKSFSSCGSTSVPRVETTFQNRWIDSSYSGACGISLSDLWNGAPFCLPMQRRSNF